MGATTFFIFILTITHVALLLHPIAAVNPNKGFSIKMIHIDSKESPLYPGDHLTPNQRLQRLVEQSKAQARYIESQVLLHSNATRSANPDATRLPVVYEPSMWYVAMIGIGTFPSERPTFKNYYLMIDTGSDQTWLQCEGASEFFRQDMPLYPHQSSTTFMAVPCSNHGFCGGNSCTVDGNCAYQVAYGTGSEGNGPVTYGIIAEENFTLGSNTGVLESIDLRFGCGFIQHNFNKFGNNYRDGQPDLIAGILGLGPGEQSFLNQLGVAGGAKFAYCFQAFNEDMQGSNTYLRFGADATIGRRGQQVGTTPIVVPSFQTHLYYLNLEDISVGNTRARFPRRAFEIKRGGDGGTVIDSGTIVSSMYTRHFDRVANLVRAHFNGFGIGSHSYYNFEVCFSPPGNFDIRNFPSMTLHFQQADYVVSDYRANFVTVPPGTYCLAIFREPTNKPTFLLGAIQQANKRILYDVNERALSFATESCELDNA